MSQRQQATRMDTAAFARALYFAEARRYEQVRQGAPRSNPNRVNPRFDGGVTPSGRRTVAVWPQLVAFALANKVAPALLIRGMFDSWQNAMFSATPPDPHKMMTAEAVGVARAYLYKATCDEQNRFTIQDALFKRESILLAADYNLSRDEAATRILCDKHQALSALYRHIRATELGLVEVADHYRDDAAAQYLAFYQVYNGAAPDRITQAMRDALREYLEAVNTGDTDV